MGVLHRNHPNEYQDLAGIIRSAQERRAYRRTAYLGGVAGLSFAMMTNWIANGEPSPAFSGVGVAVYAAGHLAYLRAERKDRYSDPLVSCRGPELDAALQDRDALRKKYGEDIDIVSTPDGVALHLQLPDTVSSTVIRDRLAAIQQAMAETKAPQCAIATELLERLDPQASGTLGTSVLQEYLDRIVGEDGDKKSITTLSTGELNKLLNDISEAQPEHIDSVLEKYFQHLAGTSAGLRIEAAMKTYLIQGDDESYRCLVGAVEREIQQELDEVTVLALPSPDVQDVRVRAKCTSAVTIQGRRYRRATTVQDFDTNRQLSADHQVGDILALVGCQSIEELDKHLELSDSTPSSQRTLLALLGALQVLNDRHEAGCGSPSVPHASTRHDKLVNDGELRPVQKGATLKVLSALAVAFAAYSVSTTAAVADMDVSYRKAHEAYAASGFNGSYEEYLESLPLTRANGAALARHYSKELDEKIEGLLPRGGTQASGVQMSADWNIGNAGSGNSEPRTVVEVEGFNGASTEGYWSLATQNELQITKDGSPLATRTPNRYNDRAFEVTLSTKRVYSQPYLKAEVALVSVSNSDDTFQLPIREGMRLDAAEVQWTSASGEKRAMDMLVRKGHNNVAEVKFPTGQWSMTNPKIVYWMVPGTEADSLRADSDMEFYEQVAPQSYSLWTDIAPTRREDSMATIAKEVSSSKTYSLDPLPDNFAPSSLDELQKELENADTANCNTAATEAILTYGTRPSDDKEYNLASGFYNDGDNKLTTRELHAWIVDDKGKRYDATPAGGPQQPLPEIQQRGLSTSDGLRALVGVGLAGVVGVAGAAGYRRRKAMKETWNTRTDRMRYRAALYAPATKFAANMVYGTLFAEPGAPRSKDVAPITTIVRSMRFKPEALYDQVAADHPNLSKREQKMLQQGLKYLSSAAEYYDAEQKKADQPRPVVST